MKIKIFADCADLAEMEAVANRALVTGFTTNPTLMRAAGVLDYEKFSRAALKRFPFLPVSIEVIADKPHEMFRQAIAISSWGKMGYVKIPVVTPGGESCASLIEELGAAGVRLNVTAIMTLDQVLKVALALPANCPSIISVFAGRIADTGRDPVHFMNAACTIIRAIRPEAQLLWASPREIYNLYQAESVGCDIITMAPKMLDKLSLMDKDLEEYSIETVKMFDHDAKAAGFKIAV